VEEQTEPFSKKDRYYDRNVQLRRMYIALDQQLAVAREAGDDALATTIEAQMKDVGREVVTLNEGLAGGYSKKFTQKEPGAAQDYRQDAVLGFWKAFLSWDPDRGTTLGGWSRPYIKGETNRGVRRLEHGQISDNDFARRQDVRDAVGKLRLELGVEPTHEQVAAVLGITPGMVERCRMAATVSLDAPVNDGDATVGDLVVANRAATFGSAADDDTWWAHLRNAAADLSAEELVVMARRFGWDGAPTQSVIETGALLGIGRGTVLRIERRASDKVTARVGYVPEPL
jgi:DNA-directed RNA polymerase specialized sigma subunit